MTVSAHNSYQRMPGGSRQFMIQESPPPFGKFFDELHPHLRNVSARAMGIAERMSEYLQRRPGRTPAQIAAAIGLVEGAAAQNVLNKHPDLFRREGRLWYVVSTQSETHDDLPVKSKAARTMTTKQSIVQYMTEHGQATATEIAQATGLNYSTVVSALSRGIDGIKQVGEVGKRPYRSIVWGLRE